MPYTEVQWKKRVRDAERLLRDARRERRYVMAGQIAGVLVLATGITLCAVFGSLGWVMMGFLGLAVFGIATAMASEWTLYQSVLDARDRVEDLTMEYDAWKMEQATTAVQNY